MRSVLKFVRRVSLIGSLLSAGCLSDTEGPHSISSVDPDTTRERPALAPIDEQKIRQIPVAEIAKTSPQQRSAEYHRVQPGETLRVIAARFQTTAEELARDNGLGDPDHLTVGQWLWIPKGHH